MLGFVRLTTHPRVLRPLPVADALDRIESWLRLPHVHVAQPSDRHFGGLRASLERIGTAGNYLFRDILQLEGVRHADKLLRLRQAVAFQIGGEVSVAELGTRLGMSKNTVERYLDLLEKAYVIYARLGFSRNLRKEIAKSRRYYFYDNGVRNGLINNFNPIALRDDAGALWENYVMVERLKYNLYTGRQAESYFWRTYDRQEIDLVEERGGRLDGVEMKWTPRPRLRAPRAWREAYPASSFRVVDRENYLDFITGG